MIRSIAVLLALYAVAALRAAVVYGAAGWAVLGFFAAATAAALWLKKSWSQYLFYVFGGLLVAMWVESAARAFDGKWQYLNSREVTFSILPGLIMAFIILGLGLLVRRGFRHEPLTRH